MKEVEEDGVDVEEGSGTTLRECENN